MFKKKKKGLGYVVQDEFVPKRLPSYSPETEYIPAEYKILSAEYKGKFYKAMEEKLVSLIGKMDKHNSGKELHGFIRTQTAHLREDFHHDVAWADYQCDQIANVKETRCEELEMEKCRITLEKEENQKEMEPLKGLKAQYNVKIFGKTVALGGIVTLLAMIADMIANYSYLQGIVTMNALGFFIVVLSMAVMSDCSMWAFGILLSKSEENYMNTWIRNALYVLLLSLFLLSVAAVPMIRFGSMELQYGAWDAAGNYVAKEGGYTLAEIGVTAITSFLTAATGVLSFLFSYDKNREKAIRFEELKKKNDAIEIRLEEINKIQDYIKRTIPVVRELDQKKRETGENELRNIENGLLAKATMLWAEHVGTSETLEKASSVVDQIMEENMIDKKESENSENHTSKVHKMAV